jgi:deferrochelatase/peroxidase EfeB
MSDFQYNDLEGAAELSDAALRNLQCNILSSTGRIACEQVFHRFKSRRAFTQWLGSLKRPSDAKATDPYLHNVLFSHEGLRYLGLPEELLNQMEPAFRRGARHPRTLAKLRDDGISSWDPDHKAPWHAVELYWHSSREQAAPPPDRNGEHEFHVEQGHAIGQDGTPLPRDDAPHYNHFGLEDQSSNPIYTPQDYEQLLGTRPPGGPASWKWDQRAKLSTLLVPDPLADQAESFGSYFVFRKFKNDVDAFRHKLTAIATELIRTRGTGWWWNQYPALKELTDQELNEMLAKLGAKLPVNQALSTKAGIVLSQLIFGVGPNGQRPTGGTDNNFDYAGDAGGKVCPFSAHARAVNARGSRQAPQFEQKTVLARRGISYAGGSLFWCAQANIGEQFEYIQEKWANRSAPNLDHLPTPGVDYLVGRPESAPTGFSLDVRDSINVLASEYLFAPSLIGIRRLQALGGAV